MKYLDLNTPYALAVIDGDSGLCGSDIFPTAEEFGQDSEDDDSYSKLGGMATSRLAAVENFLGEINKEEL